MKGSSTLQSLIEAPAKGLVIEVSPDNRRVVAEVFGHAKGIVFADIGWSDPSRSFHPFHLVEGPLCQVGERFKVGETVLRIIGEEDPLCWEWLEWLNYRGTQAGMSSTREACRRAVELDGFRVFPD